MHPVLRHHLLPRPWALACLAIVACSAPGPELAVEGPPVPTAAAMDSLLAGASVDDSIAPPQIVPAVDTVTTMALTLRDIGFKDGITLQGTTDRATVAIPVNRGLVPTRLVVDVTPTPLMPGATIYLQQGQRILAQQALTDTSTQIAFALAGVITDGGRAPVTLGLNIPGRDVCAADLIYRTMVHPTSRVEYAGARVATGGINDFFQPWLKRVVFYLPEAPSLDAAQAALDAAAFVGRAYRGMSTEFVILPLPPAGTPMPEPAPDERALLWAPSGPTMVLRAEGGGGRVLALASRRDARQLFTLAAGSQLVPVEGFRATTVRPELVSAARSGAVTLAQLGLTSATAEGSAIVRHSIPFALADFGHYVTPRAIRLVLRHSALPRDGHGTMNIYLNGQLIESRQVERPDVDLTVTLPGHLMLRDNRLDVRFNVVLGQGACILGGPTFAATLDDRSTFLMADGSTLPASFDRFPSALVPAFSVLMEPRDRFRVDLAAQTIGAMQQTTVTPLAPFVVRDFAEVRGALLAIGTGTMATALDAPLSGEGFRMRDAQGRVWDEYAPTESFAAMQAFTKDGRDILLLHHTREDGAPLDALVRESLAAYGWFGVHGDLALRGPAGPTTVLNLANSGWVIEQTLDAPASLFTRWRSAIFLGAGLLLLVLAIWLYPRVVRRELDTTG